MMMTRSQIFSTSVRMCVESRTVCCPPKFLDGVERLADLHRVEAGRRLVEDENGRVGEHRVGEADALAVALRERAEQPALHFLDAALLQAVVDPRGPAGAVDALELRAIRQVLADAHLGVQRHALRQVADALADVHRLVHHVVPGDPGVAAGCGQPGRENAHAGGLPGPVRAEEPDEFAGLHLEGDVVHGQDGAVVLGQVLDLDRGRRHVVTVSAVGPETPIGRGMMI